MIISVNKFTINNVKILAAWNGVSEIVDFIENKEKEHSLETWKTFMNFISSMFKSAKSAEELKKIKKGFQIAYHSDIANSYTGRDEKFKQIEDMYELALQYFNKSVSLKQNSNDSNKSDAYNSIKNINEFMENFVKEVKFGNVKPEEIDIKILNYIKRNPELSLNFSMLIINYGLTNDAMKLYPGLLNSIISNPQTKKIFYDFLKELNLKIPLQFKRK